MYLYSSFITSQCCHTSEILAVAVGELEEFITDNLFLKGNTFHEGNFPNGQQNLFQDSKIIF